MVSALVSGLSDLGLSLAWDIGLCSCTLFSHSAALIPGVQMGTSRFNAGGSPATDQHPIQERVEKPIIASYYGNQDKLQHDRPLGSHVETEIR